MVAVRRLSLAVVWGLLFAVVWGLLTAVASFVMAHRLLTRALLPSGMWDFPGSGVKFVCPALAVIFLTSGPPGKSFFVLILLEGLDCCVSFRCTMK